MCAWNDVKNNTNPDKQELKFLPGATTQIRIMDEQPVTRWVHWLPKANGGKGMGVSCLGKGCPLCEVIKQDKAAKLPPRTTSRKSHGINVINRTTGEINILDKGNTVFDQLLGLLEVMGDLRNFDIMFRVSNGGTQNASYTCVPLPVSPLTDAEKLLPLYDLNEIFKPLTAEQTMMLFNGATFKEVFGDDEQAATTDGVTEALQDIDVDLTKPV